MNKLTEAEIVELKSRKEAYLKNPESGLRMEESKKQMLAKYGL